MARYFFDFQTKIVLPAYVHVLEGRMGSGEKQSKMINMDYEAEIKIWILGLYGLLAVWS